MNVIVTGGAGFIGSHVINYLLNHTNYEIFCIDKLSYASMSWKRLRQLDIYNHKRLHCITWDLTVPFSEGLIEEFGDINIIIHMAAETHVDRSILNPVETIHNNVMSTTCLLEYARKLKNLAMFQYFSTDEIFGPAPDGVNYRECDRQYPTNPYSASKAASENICLAYANTYNLPIIITNLMNAFGITQHCEKFIPLVMKKILEKETIVIHTKNDGLTAGSRFYIDTENICRAVIFILENGRPGEVYNIKGLCEVDNLTLAQKIASIMKCELKYLLTDVHT